MKTLRMALLAAAAFLVSAARAEERAARAEERAVADPTALAVVDAMIAFCSKTDPASAARYQEQLQLVAPNATEDALAKVRDTDAYRVARTSSDELAAKADPHDASEACSLALAQSR